jgi:dihydrofolate synthase/folylpolyglutamate synthase
MTRSNYNLAQWLEWMEKNHPTEIDLGLSRVGQVFRNMHLDLSASKIISIAGTNGKGSTTAILESIYLAANYTTIAYTSPHMLHYNERVRVEGKDVTDALLIEAFNAIDVAMGPTEQRITLSYFEIGTLAAIYLVSTLKPDVALLEVGLGGRLDAVNIVDADVAVITTLAVDHIDWLGDDIEQIGLEKAGIARQHKPLICGEISPPASIAQYSNEHSIELLQVNQIFKFELEADGGWTWVGVDKDNAELEYNGLPVPNLPVQNAATALQVLAKAALPCPKDAIIKGLASACAMGRLQSVNYNGADILLDVAHNPQSAKYLASSLQDKGLTNKVHLVLGVLVDKDCQGLISELQQVAKHWHIVTLDVYRGQSAKQLEALVLSQGVESQCVSCYEAIDLAINCAVASCKEAEQVVVAGSFVTVTQALELLKISN